MPNKKKHTDKRIKPVAQEKKKKTVHHKRVKSSQDLQKALNHFEEVMQATHAGWWMP